MARMEKTVRYGSAYGELEYTLTGESGILGRFRADRIEDGEPRKLGDYGYYAEAYEATGNDALERIARKAGRDSGDFSTALSYSHSGMKGEDRWIVDEKK